MWVLGLGACRFGVGRLFCLLLASCTCFQSFLL